MYEDGFHNSLKENFTNQLLIKDMKAEQLAGINTPVDATELNRLR